jgi:hypothetical protein
LSALLAKYHTICRGIVEIHLDEQHTVGFFVGETYDRGSVIEVNGFVLTSAEHEDVASESYRRNLRGRDLIRRRQNKEIIRTDDKLMPTDEDVSNTNESCFLPWVTVW